MTNDTRITRFLAFVGRAQWFRPIPMLRYPSWKRVPR
jgi:hypothetical protein